MISCAHKLPSFIWQEREQAGAELCQAQFKLRLAKTALRSLAAKIGFTGQMELWQVDLFGLGALHISCSGVHFSFIYHFSFTLLVLLIYGISVY